MLASVSICWLTEYSHSRKLPDDDFNHSSVNGMPGKAAHRSQKFLPCSRGSITSFISTLSNCSSLLEPKDGPASCLLCQGPPFKDWLVIVHVLTSETYCSTLNIKPRSKLPSVDKNIFGSWCNVKWTEQDSSCNTVWFYLWKENFVEKWLEGIMPTWLE